MTSASPVVNRASVQAVEVRVFGSTTLLIDGVASPLGRRQVRRLAAALVSRAGAAVSADVLIDHLWGDDLPANPRKTLHVILSRFRTALGPYAVRLVSESDGYRLDADLIDIDRFSALVAGSHDRADPDVRTDLRHALDLWRGEPFADDPDAALLVPRRTQLHEQRWSASARLAELLVDAGQYETAAALTAPMVANEPADERIVVTHARSLARTGRKSDALAVTRRATDQLRGSFGLEPSAALLAVEREILTGHVDLQRSDAPRHRPDGDLFVGRSGELARLEKAQPGIAMVVVGEAGAGKSSLFRRFVVEQNRAGRRVVRVDVSPTPERPMDAVAQLCLALLDSGDLASAPSEYRAALARLCPELDAEVSISLTRDSMIDDLTRFIELAAHDATVIIDDAHWLEGGSAEVIERLLRRGRVTLVVGLRPSDGPHLRFLIDDPAPAVTNDDAVAGRSESFALAPLDREDVAELVAAVTQRSIDDGLVERIAEQAGGNALFIRLVVDRWIDDSELGGPWPSNVLVAVTERLDDLARPVRDTLDVAALIGPTFGIRTLRQLRPNADSELEAAERAGIVRVVAGSDIGSFRHALVADSCAELVAVGRGVALHDEIGRMLELDGAGASEYAQHYRLAAALDPVRAIRASLEAASEFIVGFDWITALTHIRAAGAVADEHAVVNSALHAQILVRRGTVERALSIPDYVEHLIAGCELARMSDQHELFVVAVTELCGHGATTGVGAADQRVLALLDEALTLDIAPALRAELCAASVPLFATSDTASRGRALFREAWEIAQELGDPEVEAAVTMQAHLGFSHPEDLELLVAAAERMAELAGSDSAMLWESAFVRFECAVTVGDVDAAHDAIDEMRLHVSGVDGRPRDFGMAFSESAYATLCGDLDAAEDRAGEALAIGMERFDPSWALTIYGLLLIGIRLDQGRLGELEPMIKDAVESRPDYIAFRPIAALVAVSIGDLDAARRHVDAFTRNNYEDLLGDITHTAILLFAAPPVAAVGTPDQIADLRDRLLPFAGRMSWNGASSAGPIDRGLSALCRALGDEVAADRFAESAAALVESFRVTRTVRPPAQPA